MIAKTQAEADKQTAERDVIGKVTMQNLIRDTYQPSPPVEGLDLPNAIENPTEWIAMEDIRFAGSSGPILIRRGQHINSPSMIGELRRLKANIKPLR